MASRPSPDPAALAELPDDYVVERSARAYAAVHVSVSEALASAGWSATEDPAGLEPSELAGRRPLLQLETTAGRLFVRRFVHGGLLRWATGARFLDPGRPFREILLSAHLVREDIATPCVVAARARRAKGGPGWNLEVLTRPVPDTLDLGVQLARIQHGDLPRGERAVLLRSFGELVARLHDADFLHADLNPNNVLVERAPLASGQANLWVLDLDRSRIGPVSTEERLANVARLFRHVERREAERGPGLTRTDYLRFLSGFVPAGAPWKELWRVLAASREKRRWHRLGWKLERRFGPPDPRA